MPHIYGSPSYQSKLQSKFLLYDICKRDWSINIA